MNRQQESRAAVFRTYLTGAVAAAALLIAVSAKAEDKGGTKTVQLPGVTVAAESAAEKVFTTGQPSKETLEALAKKGVKVVVNLRRTEEMSKVTWDEKSTAESLGMKYISVPMSTSLPKDDGVKTLLDTLGNSQKEPVLLHCASSIRAGAVWALYLGVSKHVPEDAAIAEGKKAGLNNESLEHIVRNRIAASAKK